MAPIKSTHETKNMLSRSQQYGLMLRSKRCYNILWRCNEVPCQLVCWGGLGRTPESFRPRTGARCHWLANVNGEQRSEFCCNLLALICELCRGAADTTPPQRHLLCAVRCMNSEPLHFYHVLELEATPCSSVWCNIFTDFWRSVCTFWPKALHLRCCTRFFFSPFCVQESFFSDPFFRIHLFRCLS